MPNHTNERPFCNTKKLIPSHAYVAWLDVMGIQSIMSRSFEISSNFVLKIHIAALEAPRANVTLYPVMDGIYAVATIRNDMLNFLEYMFSRLADLFVSTQEFQHRFLLKGALAYGPVLHGSAVTTTESHTLASEQAYRNSLLLGMPMIQAHSGESLAPPFGVYIHESARWPAQQQPITFAWWTWWLQPPPDNRWAPLTQELRQELNAYFDWCSARSNAIGYPPDRIKVHREMVNQYFSDVSDPAPAIVAPNPNP